MATAATAGPNGGYGGNGGSNGGYGGNGGSNGGYEAAWTAKHRRGGMAGATAVNGGSGNWVSGPNAGILNGNQASTLIQVPVNACGNAVSVLGFADASCSGGATAVNESARTEDATTGFNSGILNGNQLSTVVQAPVNVCGNSVAVLGFSSASCSGGATAVNGGGWSAGNGGSNGTSNGWHHHHGTGGNGGSNGTGNSNGGYGGNGGGNGGYGGGSSQSVSHHAKSTGHHAKTSATTPSRPTPSRTATAPCTATARKPRGAAPAVAWAAGPPLSTTTAATG